MAQNILSTIGNASGSLGMGKGTTRWVLGLPWKKLLDKSVPGQSRR